MATPTCLPAFRFCLHPFSLSLSLSLPPSLSLSFPTDKTPHMNIYVYEIDAATITVTANYTPKHTHTHRPKAHSHTLRLTATAATTRTRKQLLPIYGSFAVEFCRRINYWQLVNFTKVSCGFCMCVCVHTYVCAIKLTEMCVPECVWVCIKHA